MHDTKLHANGVFCLRAVGLAAVIWKMIANEFTEITQRQKLQSRDVLPHRSKGNQVARSFARHQFTIWSSIFLNQPQNPSQSKAETMRPQNFTIGPIREVRIFQKVKYKRILLKKWQTKCLNKTLILNCLENNCYSFLGPSLPFSLNQNTFRD